MGKSIPAGKAKVKPRGLTRRPQHSEDKLLDAARLVFARDGLRAATVDDIAAQAGSTKPTFYARFGSKHELYEATFRREVDALTEHLLAAYADAGTVPMREFVRRAVDAWFAFAAARPDGLELLFFGDHPGDTAGAFDGAARRIEDQIALAIGAYTGRPAGPGADLLATMIVGSCTHAARHVLTHPELDAARAADLTAAYVTSGLRGADPGGSRLTAASHPGPSDACGHGQQRVERCADRPRRPWSPCGCTPGRRHPGGGLEVGHAARPVPGGVVRRPAPQVR